MVPRTRAPNAIGSMEDERVLSNASTFETFAAHYGDVLRKHKKKIRHHVINNPPRRSLRLLEKMIKQEQNCEQVNSSKKGRRTYSTVSENNPQELIPVMPLSALRQKRKCELMSTGDYSPAPIKTRRRAKVSFLIDGSKSYGNRTDSVETLPAVKCEPDIVTNSFLEDKSSMPSIIQIKQDFLKNIVHRRSPVDERSSNFETHPPEQSRDDGFDWHGGANDLKDEESVSQVPPGGVEVVDLTECEISFPHDVAEQSDWNDIKTSPKQDPNKMYPSHQSIDDGVKFDDDVKSVDRSPPEGARNEGSIDERSDDGALNDKRPEDGAYNDQSSDKRLSEERTSFDMNFGNRTPSEGRSESIASHHGDSGMATTDCSDNNQDDDSEDDVCFVATENDAGAYRNQEDSFACPRPDMDTFIPHQDEHFNAIHEGACMIPPQENNCSYEMPENPVQSGEYNSEQSSLVCPQVPYADAVEAVEDTVSHPDHHSVLNSPLHETEMDKESAPCLAEEVNADKQAEPVQIRIEEITDSEDNEDNEDNEEEPSENDFNQNYIYNRPSHAFPFAEENPAPGMQFHGLDPQFQQYQGMYQQPETAQMPAQPPTAEYSQMPEPMYHPMYAMNPTYNCWLDVNLQPLVQVQNNFVRQGAFAIKYGDNTAILTGMLHFNSELENNLFEAHFQQPPPTNQYYQTGPQQYPPREYAYGHHQAEYTPSQGESDSEPESESETEDQQEINTDIQQQRRARSNRDPVYNQDGIEIMEIESSDEEDDEQAAVEGSSSSHARASHRVSAARECFLKMQSSIRHMRQKFGRLGFSANLKKYLIHTHVQRMRFTGHVIFSTSSNTPIRLRTDLREQDERRRFEENPERQLCPSNRVFSYEIHFRNDCGLAYVVHDTVDFLCPDCKFLKAYVRFMLGLSRISDGLQITELEAVEG